MGESAKSFSRANFSHFQVVRTSVGGVTIVVVGLARGVFPMKEKVEFVSLKLPIFSPNSFVEVRIGVILGFLPTMELLHFSNFWRVKPISKI